MKGGAKKTHLKKVAELKTLANDAHQKDTDIIFL